MIEVPFHRGQHQTGVTFQVVEWHTQVKVAHQLQHRVQQGVGLGVVGLVGGLGFWAIVLDVLGRHRRPHEDEIVLKIGSVEDLGGDRIEESLGQLRLVVVHQQPDVVQLDLLPHIHGLVLGTKLLGQPLDAFPDTQVVELDAVALGALLPPPVASLEPVLGSGRLGAKQLVVPVEAVHHRFGDVMRDGGIEPAGEHGLRWGLSLADKQAAGLHATQPRRRAATLATERAWVSSSTSSPLMTMHRSCNNPSLSP